MTVKVRIPLVLTRFTGGVAEVEARASSVRELVESLEKTFPGIKATLCDESGELRNLLNVFVNDKDIRFLDGEETALQEGDRVSIVPLIAGG